MARFIDPRGQPTFGIALCARCSRKFPLAELSPDPNAPGLMVCKDDLDELDPYRLPARQTERINLPFVRPDDPLTGFSSEDDIGVFGVRITEQGDVRITEQGDVRIIEQV